MVNGKDLLKCVIASSGVFGVILLYKVFHDGSLLTRLVTVQRKSNKMNKWTSFAKLEGGG